MNKTFVAAIISLLFLPVTLAGNTVIQGYAKNYGELEIRLLKFEDYVSFKREVIATATVDNEGFFKLDFFLPHTDFLMLAIGLNEASLFVEPGQLVELNINYHDSLSRAGSSLPLQKPLDMYVEGEADSTANHLIFEFDSLMGKAFNEATLKMILYKKDYKQYNKIKKDIEDWMEEAGHEFVENYAEYRLGMIEIMIFSRAMTQLGERLIATRDVLYRNIEYMHFFESFVRSYVPGKSRSISPAMFEKALNVNSSYSALDDLLGRDTVFRNERVRELAMIVLLKNYYDHENFSSEKIDWMLTEISEISKFDRHRKMANLVLQELKRFESGGRLKDFSFGSGRTDTVSFSDFEGRYLIINFFTSQCLDCMLEMDIMKKLYEEREDERDLYMLSISVDAKEKQFEKFMKKTSYPWEIVWFNHDYDLIEYFDLRNIPRFVLIGPDGDIINKYYPKMSKDGIGNILKRLDKKR